MSTYTIRNYDYVKSPIENVREKITKIVIYAHQKNNEDCIMYNFRCRQRGVYNVLFFRDINFVFQVIINRVFYLQS